MTESKARLDVNELETCYEEILDINSFRITDSLLESINILQSGVYDVFEYVVKNKLKPRIATLIKDNQDDGLSRLDTEAKIDLLFKDLKRTLYKKEILTEKTAESFLGSLSHDSQIILSSVCLEYKNFISRLENKENLCGNRFDIVRYNPKSTELESLVLEISGSQGDSEFSKDKVGKIELVGGKYMDYDSGNGPNRAEVVNGLKDKEVFSKTLLKELEEETGISEEYVKCIKYIGTTQRAMEGVWSKDPNVKQKIDDLFVVEVYPFAEVSLNQPDSDDFHSSHLWVPMRDLSDFVTAKSSKDALDMLPKNNFPILWEAVYGDISNITKTKVKDLFDSLNTHKNFFDSFRKKGQKEHDPLIKSFIDFGRIDQVRLSDLKKLLFRSFELDEQNLESDLSEKLVPALNVALDFEINHRNRDYTPEFLKFMTTHKMTSIQDVHNFVRGYSRHPNYTVEWKNWLLDIFKVAFCYKYLRDSIPNIENLDEYQKQYDRRIKGILSSMDLKEKNPRNKSERYDYIYQSNPKALFRLLDKLLTKHDLSITGINDAVRGRPTFVEDSVRQTFVRNVKKNFNSEWRLKWAKGKVGRESEIKSEGLMLTNDGVRIPAETQTLLEEDYLKFDLYYEKHHDVYQFIKQFHASDRTREVSEDEMVLKIKEAISNPDVIKDKSANEVEKDILNLIRNQFIRIPSIQDYDKFAYYSKKNLINIVGQHQRADEDMMFGNMMKYLADLENRRIDDLFDPEDRDIYDEFDKDLQIFSKEILQKVRPKKREALEKFYRMNIRKTVD